MTYDEVVAILGEPRPFGAEYQWDRRDGRINIWFNPQTRNAPILLVQGRGARGLFRPRLELVRIMKRRKLAMVGIVALLALTAGVAVFALGGEPRREKCDRLEPVMSLDEVVAILE